MFYRKSINSDGSGPDLYIVKEAVYKLSRSIHVECADDYGTIYLIRPPTIDVSTN